MIKNLPENVIRKIASKATVHRETSIVNTLFDGGTKNNDKILAKMILGLKLTRMETYILHEMNRTALRNVANRLKYALNPVFDLF